MAVVIGWVLAAALAGAADAPAKAAETAAPAAEAGKPAKPPKPKLVCVEEAQMGSLFKHRICATEAEWTKRRERDIEMMSRGGGKASGGESR